MEATRRREVLTRWKRAFPTAATLRVVRGPRERREYHPTTRTGEAATQGVLRKPVVMLRLMADSAELPFGNYPLYAE